MFDVIRKGEGMVKVGNEVEKNVFVRFDGKQMEGLSL